MKGLKELNTLYRCCCERINHIKGKTDTTELEIKVSNAYDTIEKELRALEIIRKKKVWIIELLSCFELENNPIIKANGLKKYNEQVEREYNKDLILTQQEHNLLKEVLKNE